MRRTGAHAGSRASAAGNRAIGRHNRPAAAPRPARSTASASASGVPIVVEHQARQQCKRRAARLGRAHQHADRRLRRASGWTGSTVDRAESRSQRAQHVGKAVRAPDQLSVPRGRSSRAARRGPGGERRARRPHGRAARLRSGDARWRAGSLNGGFIRTRATDLGRAGPAAANARAGAATSSTTARTRSASPLRCAFSCASAASPASISTSVTLGAVDARRQRKPGRADAGAEIDDLVAGARRTCRRQQDRVVAEAMSARRLQQPQPAAEHGVLGHRAGARSSDIGTQLVPEARILEQLARAADLVVGDQHAGAAARRSSLRARSCSGRAPHARMSAPSSSASIAEISTASLVRTSSRNAALLNARRRSPVLARRAVAPDRPEASSRAGRGVTVSRMRPATIEQEGQQHQPGREDRGRDARDDALLEIGHDDRDREADRGDRERDAERRRRTPAAAPSDRA